MGSSYCPTARLVPTTETGGGRSKGRNGSRSGTAWPHGTDATRSERLGYTVKRLQGEWSRARRIRTLRVDVAGELGRGGDLTGSSGSGAAASAAAWPSGTGAYSLSSGIAIEGRVPLAGASGTRGGAGRRRRSRGPRRGVKVVGLRWLPPPATAAAYAETESTCGSSWWRKSSSKATRRLN
jgi:hypothetical protein